MSLCNVINCSEWSYVTKWQGYQLLCTFVVICNNAVLKILSFVLCAFQSLLTLFQNTKISRLLILRWLPT